MKVSSFRNALLAAGLLVGATLASAQTTNATATAPTAGAGKTPAVRPAMPPLPTEIQNLIKDFATQRDAMLAARKALLDQLKAATTDADKQAIIAQLRAQMQDLRADQRELGKQIREQLRELRKNRPTTGTGGG